jgi:hypothetical protein
MLSFDETAVVRKCGSSFAYCNGNCSDCPTNNTYATNSTDAVSMYAHPHPLYDCDAFGKPSKEAYERAKQNRMFASDSLRLCRKRRDELIDALAKERDNEKHYMELYEMNRDIVRKYEIYEELEANE